MNYTNLVINSGSYSTEDGLYYSKPDSTGHSYWFSVCIKQGSTSYDYFFFTGESGIEKALKVLNKILLKQLT